MERTRDKLETGIIKGHEDVATKKHKEVEGY